METEFMFRLKLALSDKGITRTELSQRSGVAKGDITHYLKGDYVPKQDKCYLLAKALDVDPGWLMTGYGPSKEIFDSIEKELDSVPITPEARIISEGIDKMSPERREQALKVMQAIFSDIFDGGKKE